MRGFEWIVLVVWGLPSVGMVWMGWQLRKRGRQQLADWGAVDGQDVRARSRVRLGALLIVAGIWIGPLWQLPVGWIGRELDFVRYEPLSGVSVKEFEARTGKALPRSGYPDQLWVSGWWLAPITPFRVEITADNVRVLRVARDG
jgi:hypothetical protein